MSTPVTSLDLVRAFTGTSGAELVPAVQRLSQGQVESLAAELLATPLPQLPAPPSDQLWPLVNARASLLSRGAQGHVDAPGPAGLNLMAAMNPRELGGSVFSNSVLRALLYGHGLVIEDPLVMAAELLHQTPAPSRKIARAFVEAACASLAQIDALIDASIVRTFFGSRTSTSTEAQMAAALAESAVSADELWQAFEASYIDGLSPALQDLWSQIRGGNRHPPLDLISKALTETDRAVVEVFVQVVAELRPRSVIDNTIAVVASAIDDAAHVGGGHDVLCGSPLFAKLLFLGAPDPVGELRAHQLAATPVPSIDTLTLNDVVSMRSTSEAFERWRRHLAEALERAHRLRAELGDGVDVANQVDETLAPAREALEREARSSRVFSRDGRLALVAGALGAGTAATMTRGPGAAALAAGAGAASSIVQRVFVRAAQRRQAHVLRHYMLFSRPSA